MRQDRKLLTLAMLLCVSLACESTRDHPTPRSAFTGYPCLCFEEVLPDDWQHVRTDRLDTNNDGKKEWVVLYRFDISSEQEKRGGPVAAVVYQPDGNKPPNIIARELTLPDEDYLCEGQCILTMENVLSGLEADELVVEDYCSDQPSGLTIFGWDEDQGEYLARGHFHGDCITITLDEITVRKNRQDRAQLSTCETYHAWDNKTYYQPGGQCTPVPCEKMELEFSNGEPEDVCCSPYPEKVVLAFYNHYNEDERAPLYFDETVRDRLRQCDNGECGCVAPRHEIDQVRVLELTPEPSSEAKYPDPDRATVVVKIICEPRNGAPEGERYIRWHLIREDARWQLERPE